MSHYVIERSVNGTTFTAAGRVNASNSSAAGTAYSFTDNVSDVTDASVYYRLVQVDKSGSEKLSNILVFKLNSKTANVLTISPNPANTYFVLKVKAAKDGMATIRITDMLGKVMVTQNSRLSVGTNAISINELGKFSSST